LEGKAEADVTLENKDLRYKGGLWVPDSVDLSKMMPQDDHDSEVAGHKGQEMTVQHVRRTFIWW